MLGKRLGKQMKHFASLIDQLTADDIDRLQQQGQIDIDGQSFTEEEIVIYRKAKEGFNAVSNRFISMEIDPNLTDELIAEGMVREVISRIQKTRKTMGLEVTDTISISIHTSPDVQQWIEKHQDYLQEETLANQLDFSLAEDAGENHALEMGDVRIDVRK